MVEKEVAKQLGLNEDVKVVGGGGDQAVGAVGTGTVSDGIVSVSLGTSGVVFAASDKYEVDQKNRLHSFNHANGAFTQMGVMLSAAYCLQWWAEEVKKRLTVTNISNLTKEASKVPAGVRGLYSFLFNEKEHPLQMLMQGVSIA